MKTLLKRLLPTTFVAMLAATLAAQTTNFTYQGVLNNADTPVDGAADFEFALFDAPVGGVQIGSTQSALAVDVAAGLFMVDVDFGAAAFDGNDLWLEISVAQPAGGSFTTLSPRTPLASTPYALKTRGIFVDDLENVGIGTNTPTVPLHVIGNVRADNFGVPNPNSPGATVNLNWHNDIARIRYGGTGTGSQNGFVIQGTGDSEKLRIYNNGGLGLGGATPGSVISNSRLAVGSGHVEVSNNFGFFSRNAAGNGIGAGIDTTSSDDMHLFAGGTSHAFLGADGNFGFGTATPDAKVEIVRSSSFDPALLVTHNGSGLAIEAEQTLGNNSCAKFSVTATNGNGTAVIADSDGTGSAGSFSQSNLAATSPAMRINTFSDNANNFGLSVIANNGASAANFFCNDTAEAADGVFARVRGSGDAGIFQAEGTGTALVANNTSVGHIVRFQDNGVDVVVVDTQGDLGVGTANPATNLDVRDSSASSNVMNLERESASIANADMLQIEAHPDADDNTQFIECERGSDIEFRVWGDGDVTADGTYTGPADFAEMMHVPAGADTVEPGDVMVIDVNNPRALAKATTANSTLVAGIYSTRPGYLGTEHDLDQLTEQLVGRDELNPEEARAVKTMDLGKMIDEIPLAVVGIVPCKVSAENGAIRPGDLLVTSTTAGHAMRSDDPRNGTIVGKALGSLDSGTGKIRVLVTLQ